MNEQYVIEKYREGYGATYIANELGTYPNKILRILKRNNEPIRSHSESQKLVLEKGLAKHPTKGQKTSDNSKRKISESMAKNWSNRSEEDLKSFSEKLSESWKNKSYEEIMEMNKKACSAVSNAGRHGSKLENFLVDKLTEMGYNSMAHVKGVVADTELEPDITLPDLQILIEVDGPAHFFPIFGEEKFKKTQESDRKKNGIFLSNGFCVIRVKQMCKTLSQYKKNKILSDLVEVIEKVKLKHEATIIELELK